MKSLRHLLLIAAVAMIAMSCSDRRAGETEQQTEDEDFGGPVEIMEISRTTISRTLQNVANVMPVREVNLSPASPGRIDRINVEVGDRVRAGQVLFTMDRTQLAQAKIQMAALEQEIARLDTLMKTGSARQIEYDQLITQYEVLESNIEFLEENTTVVAPFNGIVTGRYYENHEMFSGAPTAASAGKVAVVTVTQINPVKIVFNASEQHLPMISAGMPVDVTADARPDDTFSGRVSVVHPSVNPMTRTFQVEVEVPNRGELLRPGMFTRASIDFGEVEAFVIPANTILLQEGTNIRYVFVEENGRARRVNVVPGARFDDMVEVNSDLLREGDRLIVQGQARLSDNDRVTVVNSR